MLPNQHQKHFTNNHIVLALAPRSSNQKTGNAIKMEDEHQASCAPHHNQVCDSTTSEQPFGKELRHLTAN